MELKDIYRAAGMPAMVLALVSISYMLVHYYLLKGLGLETSATYGLIIYNLLDCIKIILCIWLMKHFMEKFLLQTSCDLVSLRRMGTAIALLSALTFAAASMAFYMWHPELIKDAIDLIVSSAGDKLDLNQRNSLDILNDNFPRIIFFAQLVYCFLFGWVLSAILAPRIILRHISDNE